HRIVWAVPLLALLIYWAKSWPKVRRAVADPRVLCTLMATTVILGVNWFLYIYAINSAQILQSSLGYYINPLVNVGLGVLVLGERLNRWRALAILLAAVGVVNLAVTGDHFPWIALTLAGTFGVYGLIRKVISVASIEGLFIEAGLLLPVALGYLVYLAVAGQSSFSLQDGRTDILLMLAGPVTALPLIWFTSGARRLDYATIGFFQYIAPSLHFLLAVFLYDEPFGPAHLITFACIWTALAIFSVDGLRRSRRGRLPQPQRLAEGG
ncbi:MAG TPA: EamA family transporter RarD, partial [Kiloniellaceae bacterium]|nr:EamA family transporter RarD [Kiloniellaceae bacterium]